MRNKQASHFSVEVLSLILRPHGRDKPSLLTPLALHSPSTAAIMASLSTARVSSRVSVASGEDL